ncbi:MAG: Rieske 2Fe-2S domain-containing protein [Pseudomonadales bacterium]
MNIKSVKDYIALPLLYNHWYVAGTVTEFSEHPKAKILLEKSIVFYRTSSGELTALQNRCLHRAYPLSKGKLEGDNIVCGYHGARFNTEGELVRIPCQKRTPKLKLRKYPVKEIGPLVMIWMGDGEADESRYPESGLSHLADPAVKILDGYYHVKGSYLFMQENLHDLTHIPYLHRESFNVDDRFFDAPPPEVTKTDRGVVAKQIHGEHTLRTFLTPSVLTAVEDKQLWRVDYDVAPSPGLHLNQIITGFGEKEGDGNESDLMNTHIMHFLTPETKTTCHYWFAISIDYFSSGDEAFLEAMPAFFERGFLEDLDACDSMQQLLNTETGDFKDANFAGDKSGMLFRGVMLGWAKEEYADLIASNKLAVDDA